MRRWILSLVGVGLLMACGTSAAMAHGGGYGYPGRYAPRGGYHHASWRGYGAPRYGVGYGGCGPYPAAVPYGYGVGYGAYPAAGLGLATRNFSFWLQP